MLGKKSKSGSKSKDADNSADEADNGVIPVIIKDKHQLNKQYLYYIKGGGLFIPTNKEYHLGDEVTLVIELLDNTEKIQMQGIVVWVTPQATGGRIKGIGVQFKSEGSDILCKKIETYLSGMPKSSTYTL